jgi:hypothetical protein
MAERPLGLDEITMKIKISNVTVVAIAIALGALGLTSTQLARAQDDEGPMSSLQFVVVRDTDGKPLRNAQVVLHPVQRKGKQAQGEMDLKTDADGKTTVDGIPYCPLRVQVMAPHYQTFGEDYEINKPQMQITVKMKHPGDQYSTYENHGDDKKPQ